ncbi:hypothetical protein QTA58_23960 [Neorhizobium sp. CSC1952]|uniref:peptidoglycan-binding domain-containing protein n=1 Tax=Neorhizobium sp. CSC1952 TaxID=2978974 RepID=UPI0025A5DE2F|nr:hypothetical protein [Rhizobium sp. CSC1952]WJR67197.1 hypothetical protein QTA58_23960 [Rhizobium sp. CSC1952]
MKTTVQDLQRRLIALGFPLPKFGPDGDFGAESIAAINNALDELAMWRDVGEKEAAKEHPGHSRHRRYRIHNRGRR